MPLCAHSLLSVSNFQKKKIQKKKKQAKPFFFLDQFMSERYSLPKNGKKRKKFSTKCVEEFSQIWETSDTLLRKVAKRSTYHWSPLLLVLKHKSKRFTCTWSDPIVFSCLSRWNSFDLLGTRFKIIKFISLEVTWSDENILFMELINLLLS